MKHSSVPLTYEVLKLLQLHMGEVGNALNLVGHSVDIFGIDAWETSQKAHGHGVI